MGYPRRRPGSSRGYRLSARDIWTALGGGALYVANTKLAMILLPVLEEVSKLGGNFMFGYGMKRVLDSSH